MRGCASANEQSGRFPRDVPRLEVRAPSRGEGAPSSLTRVKTNAAKSAASAVGAGDATTRIMGLPVRPYSEPRRCGRSRALPRVFWPRVFRPGLFLGDGEDTVRRGRLGRYLHFPVRHRHAIDAPRTPSHFIWVRRHAAHTSLSPWNGHLPPSSRQRGWTSRAARRRHRD